jgi:MFS family permease
VSFMGVRELGALYATAFVFGYSYGAVSTLFTAIIGDFFGRAQAGTLVGVLFAIAGSMAGWGPLLAGVAYDATGSYVPAFAASAGLNLVAMVFLLVCRPPRLQPQGLPRAGHEMPTGRDGAAALEPGRLSR